MPQNEPMRVIIAMGLEWLVICFLFGELDDLRVFGGWFSGGSIVRVSHGC